MAQYEYVKLSGVIIPDTVTTKDQVTSDFLLTFGTNLETRDETPQGVLINLFTAQRNSVISNNAALANQINPNISGGVYLDAISSLSGLQRNTGTPSLVSCDLTGTPAVFIPSGSTVQSNFGDIFQLTIGVTLNGLGQATGVFSSIENGAINAPSGTINQIINGVSGWETVTNSSAATLGTISQSDSLFRILRRNSLALQGLSLPESIISNINVLSGIKSSLIRENREITPQTIDNVTMLPKSIFVCIDGDSATDQSIANVLLNKTVGVTWNGSTTVPTIEPISGQSYNVKFTRADKILILVRVTASSASVPDPVTAIKNSIVDYSNGDLEGDIGLTVGKIVSPSELARSISKDLYPDIFVISVEVSLSFPISFSKENIPIEIFQKAVILESGIEVNIV